MSGGGQSGAQIPRYQVTCHTPDDNDPDRRIQGLGFNGAWTPIDTIIAEVNRSYHLWTTTPQGDTTWVVVEERNGRPYLKTQADGLEPNNLLALPHC